jgi:hypothetical protein
MPRLKAKYDHPLYKKNYPKRYLMDKSFNYPIEEIARRHPDFAKMWSQVTKQTQQKLIYATTPKQKQEIIQQSNQQIWHEILKIVRQN